MCAQAAGQGRSAHTTSTSARRTRAQTARLALTACILTRVHLGSRTWCLGRGVISAHVWNGVHRCRAFCIGTHTPTVRLTGVSFVASELIFRPHTQVCLCCRIPWQMCGYVHGRVSSSSCRPGSRAGLQTLGADSCHIFKFPEKYTLVRCTADCRTIARKTMKRFPKIFSEAEKMF